MSKVEEGCRPAAEMVWYAVSFEGALELHFCEQANKTPGSNYQSDVLEKVVRPILDIPVRLRHKPKSSHRGFEANFPNFR